MANEVFANGRELCCKKGEGKSISAFPDVCFTPPLTPATPPGVPIPYPNTAMATDTSDGTKTVKITGQEVMLKDKSNLKKAAGNEAGSAPKKGVVTSTQHPPGSPTQSKAYFNAWSMDVKFEGENVVRHLDLTTHNHASMPANTPPWPYTDSVAKALEAKCADEKKELERACTTDGKSQSVDNCTDDCKKAQKCFLPPKGKDKEWCCKPNNTGHHMVEDHWVADAPGFKMASGNSGYNAAPTVCVNRFRSVGSEHREMHNIQGVFEESFIPKPSEWTYAKGKEATLKAHGEVFKDSNCNKNGCVEAQLDAFYGEDGGRKLNAPSKQAVGEDRPLLESKYINETPLEV